ncbi:hypothetical protein ACFOEK_07355 [Litoribrevibacter euphylliae]|uniref:DUF4345 domain-containing protein n=1 Tax=Litoribrevibacter euphylliae TaxID=1834034 RepID=A0ABV7HA85_9GAMM
MISKVIIAIASLLGLAAFTNGLFMLIAPEQWYWLVPGVPERGPFNQHFLRDIGMIYMLIGSALFYGALYNSALYKNFRLLLWLMPISWLVFHAIFHAWEVVVGISGPEALLVDFAGVTLPAIVGIGLLYASYKLQGKE